MASFFSFLWILNPIPYFFCQVLSFDNYRYLMKVNLDGTFNTIHEALPHMKQQGGGLIVNVSSVAALRGLPLAGSGYCASKAAVNALGSTVASEQWESNIRVCNFCPGIFLPFTHLLTRTGEVNTPIIDQRAVPPSHEARALMLQPQDCADAILMVALLPPRAQVSELVIKPTVQQFWT
jgi:NADP-dependent 3-hydroxy acid dehydrogenase YdfG